MGNTFSVLQDFLLAGFHVLVMAPRRRWIGFLVAADPGLDVLSGSVGDALCFERVMEDATDGMSFPLSTGASVKREQSNEAHSGGY